MKGRWAEGKIIFSDFDGTFTGYGDPTEKNVNAIKDFISNGGYFTFATGRLKMDGLFDGWEDIVNAPLVCSQGALVREKGGAPIYENFFDGDIAREIVGIMEKKPFGGDADYFVHTNEQGTEYYKVVVRAKPEKIPEIYDYFYKIYGDEIQYCYSCEHLIEFLDKKSTKGRALTLVKKLVGADTAYAIGDYTNDVSMLLSADFAACPANATDDVKSVCKENILCHCNQGAVAEFIKTIREDTLK